MSLDAAIIDFLEWDISTLESGIKMMEANSFKIGKMAPSGYIIDETKETLEWYRSKVLDLKNQLASIHGGKKQMPRGLMARSAPPT